MKTALKGIKLSKSISGISKLSPVIRKMDAKSKFILIYFYLQDWNVTESRGNYTDINLRPEAKDDEFDP